MAEKLNKYGFKINHISNADNFNYEQTIIKYYDKSQEEVVEGIKQLLGGKIEYIDEDKEEIKIIIGEDYLNLENPNE
jgi:hypothetical protein